jgi:leader peptidase (prepilin peptidase) / N-methyltransferase
MIFKIAIFILGAVVGSFLNVCIRRLPKEESVIKPSSHCPHCKKPLSWYDNIPLLSYLLLRGRCRYCSQKISVQYFLVEFVCALLFLSFYVHFGGFNLLFLTYVLLGSGLIISTFIDINERIIPDEITIYGIGIGFIISIIYPRLHNAEFWLDSGLSSFSGILTGAGTIYLIGLVGNIIFKKESMGAGDVKLLAMIGAFLGWQSALLIFFIAPVFGALAGIIVKWKTGEDKIPYGPFLSLATFIVILFGDRIIDFIVPY